MRSIHGYSDFHHVEFIVGLLEEDLPEYVKTLREAKKRAPYGWAYDQNFHRNGNKIGYSEKEEYKQKELLDDLVNLGYMRFSCGELFDGESLKGTCSVYTISSKGRDLLIKLEKMLQD